MTETKKRTGPGRPKLDRSKFNCSIDNAVLRQLRLHAEATDQQMGRIIDEALAAYFRREGAKG